MSDIPSAAMRTDQATVSLGKADYQNDRKRELVVPSRGGKGYAFLRYPDNAGSGGLDNWCDIPLGWIQSKTHKAYEQSRSEQPGQRENVLVPIVPLCYASYSASGAGRPPAKDQVVSPDAGRYYVFLDGHLWRELEVQPHGFFRDVNLERYAGLDHRPATSALSDNRILVPYSIKSHQPKIEIAYAPEPWSWHRINSLGGMSETDYRLDSAKKRLAEDHSAAGTARRKRLLPSGNQKSGADQARSQRMQQVDVSGFNNSYVFKAPDGHKAATGNVDLISNHPQLMPHQGANIPFVLVHDPMGAALRTGMAMQKGIADYKALLKKIGENENYNSAITAYHVFYNPVLDESERGGHGGRLYNENDSGSRALRSAREYLDRDLIEQHILQVDNRRSMREDIRAAIAAHAALLAGHLPPKKGEQQGAAISDGYPDFIDFDAALSDYAYDEGADYLKLWDTFITYAGGLNFDPIDLSRGIDLQENLETDGLHPGAWYLTDALASGSTLRKMLFPADGDIDPYDEKDPEPSNQPPSPPANADFRVGGFAAAVAAAPSAARMDEVFLKSVGESVKVADKLLAHFISLFTRQWYHAVANKETTTIEMMVRLGKAGRIPDLKGMRLVRKGESLEGRTILDGSWRLGDKLSRQERRAKAKASSKGGRDVLDIDDPATDSVVGSTDIVNLSHNRGGSVKIDEGSWNRTWRTIETDGTQTANFTVTTIPETSSLAIAIGSEKDQASETVGMGGNTTVRAAVLRGLSKALPVALAAFEVFNFIGLLRDSANNNDAEDKDKMYVALAGVILASTEAIKAVVGEEELKESDKIFAKFAT